jgi:hypothetical protein
MIRTIGSDLTGADMIRTIGSDLTSAHMIRTVGSNLTSANMIRTVGSDLSSANMIGTVGSDLTGAHMIRPIGGDLTSPYMIRSIRSQCPLFRSPGTGQTNRDGHCCRDRKYNAGKKLVVHALLHTRWPYSNRGTACHSFLGKIGSGSSCWQMARGA